MPILITWYDSRYQIAVAHRLSFPNEQKSGLLFGRSLMITPCLSHSDNIRRTALLTACHFSRSHNAISLNHSRILTKTFFPCKYANISVPIQSVFCYNAEHPLSFTSFDRLCSPSPISPSTSARRLLSTTSVFRSTREKSFP